MNGSDRPGFHERTPRWALALALGLAVSCAVLGLRQIGALKSVEFGLYDTLVGATRAAPSPARVVLVTVNERDLQTYGYPISDALLADAIQGALSRGARVVGIDIFRPRPVAPGEFAFEEIVLRDRRIVLVEVSGEDGPAVPPPQWIEGSTQVGFADFVFDEDGKIRRALLRIGGQGAASFSFPLRVATKYLEREAELEDLPMRFEGHRLVLNGHPVTRFRGNDGAYVNEDDGGYQILLDFGGAFPRFETYSLDDLLHGEMLDEAVRDRIVLIGTTADSVRDDHTTPATPAYGLEIHAVTVERLLQYALAEQNALLVLSPLAEALVILGFGLLAALLVPLLATGPLLAAEGVVGVGVFAVGAYVAFENGWWLPAAPVTIAWLASFGATVGVSSFRERDERKRLSDLLGRFVSKDVAEQIWKYRDEFLGGRRPQARRGEITVLVSDLEGFTTASETMAPEALMEWANKFMGGLAAAISASGGILDDYAGDGIKADFGIFPQPEQSDVPNHAVAAVECALEMGRTIKRINEVERDEKRLTARVRIGIFTGRAVLGFLGSADRLKFTTIGDTVNTAARLESYQKERFSEERDDNQPFRILVGGPTRALLGDRYELQDLGEAELKGKVEKVPVYRVWGPAKPVGPGEA